MCFLPPRFVPVSEAVPASQIYVTGNFFNTLGARAQIGRRIRAVGSSTPSGIWTAPRSTTVKPSVV